MRSRDGSATTVIGEGVSQGKAASLSGEAVCCRKSRLAVRRSRKSTVNSRCAVMTSRYSPCRVEVTSCGIPGVSPHAAAVDTDDGCASLKIAHNITTVIDSLLSVIDEFNSTTCRES